MAGEITASARPFGPGVSIRVQSHAGDFESLNTNLRVQRLRVYPGWNICSLAVNGTLFGSGGEGQGDVVSSAFKWNPANQGWQPFALVTSLPAGTVLWLQATTNATLTITGIYTDPANRIVPTTGDFLPSAGLEAWDFKSAISNLQSVAAWWYDVPNRNWLTALPSPLGPQSDLPQFIAPGEAVFARSDPSAQLDVPDSALRIRYYHQDHLGSSSCVTDGQAGLVEETASFAFGHPRSEFHARDIHEAYCFAQKERDNETGCSYFERRYLAYALPVFAAADPLIQNSGGKQPPPPRTLNGYIYCAGNPLVLIDPNGCAAIDQRAGIMLEEGLGGGAVVGNRVSEDETLQYLEVSLGAELTLGKGTKDGKSFYEIGPGLGPFSSTIRFGEAYRGKSWTERTTISAKYSQECTVGTTWWKGEAGVTITEGGTLEPSVSGSILGVELDYTLKSSGQRMYRPDSRFEVDLSNGTLAGIHEAVTPTKGPQIDQIKVQSVAPGFEPNSAWSSSSSLIINTGSARPQDRGFEIGIRNTTSGGRP